MLKTDDNKLPWIKYRGKKNWFGYKEYKTEYWNIIRFDKNVIYVDPKQYERITKYCRLSLVAPEVKPYGWYV